MGCGSSIVGNDIKIINDYDMDEQYKNYGPKKSGTIEGENNDEENSNEITNTKNNEENESEKNKYLEEKKKSIREDAEKRNIIKKIEYLKVFKKKKKNIKKIESDEEDKNEDDEEEDEYEIKKKNTEKNFKRKNLLNSNRMDDIEELIKTKKENENEKDEEEILFANIDKENDNNEKNSENNNEKIILKNPKNKISNENEENNIKIKHTFKSINTSVLTQKVFLKKHPDWKKEKKKILSKFSKIIQSTEIFNIIDLAITSEINIKKSDFDSFSLEQHFNIHPTKKANNINWAKKPFNEFKEKYLEMVNEISLLEKYQNHNFNNRVINLYEIFTPEIKMLRISTNKKDLEHFKLSANSLDKPLLMLIFSFDNEDSIFLFKEILKHRKINNNKEKYIFIPVYGHILKQVKNSLFVWEMAEKNEIKDEELEIYFTEKDELNKRFEYITNDNFRLIIPKVIIIDSDKIIRNIVPPSEFNFNLIEDIDNKDVVNKEFYANFKNNIKNVLDNINSNREIFNIPIQSNLTIFKTIIYSYDESKKQIIKSNTFYETLAGKLDIESDNNEFVENINKTLFSIGRYIPRENKSLNKITSTIKYNLIKNEVKNFLDSCAINNMKYRCIFQKSISKMGLFPNKNLSQKFRDIKNNKFKIEFLFNNNLFTQQFQYAITGALTCLLEYSFFKNFDFFSCLPCVNEKFPNELVLIDYKTRNEETINFNTNSCKLIIVFNCTATDYFDKIELTQRLNYVVKKIGNLSQENKDSFELFLLYRNGDIYNIDREIIDYLNEPIFELENYKFKIIPNTNLNFPLYIMNSGIESGDSEFLGIILNKENKIIYVGNLEEIELKQTMLNLIDNKDEIAYCKMQKIEYEDFKKNIKKIPDQIEEILINKFINNENILYRPCIILSYNLVTDFEDDNYDISKRYINHLKLKLLIKECHKNFLLKSKEFKNILKKLKHYNCITSVITVPCEKFNINEYCKKCNKEIPDLQPFYYDSNNDSVYCLQCEKDLKNNNNYLTFIKTENIDDEIITDFYTNNSNIHSVINPILGEMCKLCGKKMGDTFYLNLTHFNLLGNNPMLPIDICPNCFETMEKNQKLDVISNVNFNKLGLSNDHMIYRKISYNF